MIFAPSNVIRIPRSFGVGVALKVNSLYEWNAENIPVPRRTNEVLYVTAGACFRLYSYLDALT